MYENLNRRHLLGQSMWTAATFGGLCKWVEAADKDPLFKISLTQYSLHRTLASGKLDNMDFASFTRKEFGIAAVEYWNRPFFKKATDKKYIAQMKKRADAVGVGATVVGGGGDDWGASGGGSSSDGPGDNGKNSGRVHCDSPVNRL